MTTGLHALINKRQTQCREDESALREIEFLSQWMARPESRLLLDGRIRLGDRARAYVMRALAEYVEDEIERVEGGRDE